MSLSSLLTKPVVSCGRVARRILMLVIGGTGQAIAARALTEIDQYMGTRRCVQVRVIDTDLDDRYSSLLRPFFIPLNTVRAEHIRTHPQDYPKIARELELERIPPVTATQGGDAFGSQGRLLHVATLPEIRQGVRSAMKQLLDPRLQQHMADREIPLADDRLYFFLIRSIAGAVGSGSAPILEFAVEKEALDLMGHRNRFLLSTINILPDPFEPVVVDPEKLRANAFAAINGLCEYYNPDIPERLVEYGDDPDSVIALGGHRASDLTYIVDQRNLSGDPNSDRGSALLALDNVFGLCAHFVALHAFSPMITSHYEVYANSEQEARRTVRGQDGIFSGFGLAEFKFPALLAQRLLAQQMAIAALSAARGGIHA